MQAGLGDDVHLNGGVAARVVDGSSVNLGDRHNDEMRLKRGKESNQLLVRQEKRCERKKSMVIYVCCLGCGGPTRGTGGKVFTDDPKTNRCREVGG